jgi:guanosine-3',5'-bis(diphosphate) 3'-pyrophosphohydrolase
VDALEATYRPLLEAVSFAARAHRHQLRKDGQTPYVAHVFRVCLILRHAFGIDDAESLMTAVLHDTIEDTNTDYDDVEEAFGDTVAQGAAALSKDKRLQEGPREKKYKKTLAAAPPHIKLCKLADIFDNLMDSEHTSDQLRQRTCKRSRAYLTALDSPALPPPVRRAWDVVERLLKEMERKWGVTGS